MHATITHFATCLPDWNSLDSVRRAHSDLEAAALVFFALLVVCEALAHLSDDKKTERRFDKIGKIGIVFFALAVLAEIASYPYGQRNDTLSGQQINSLDAKANDASQKAAKAVTDSSDAETKSGDAMDKAGKANIAASTATTLARGARQEADSFEKDIASARTQAAEAESHLADALQRAAEAESRAANTERKIADRHISQAQQERIRHSLSKWDGIDIRLPITMVNGDDETWTYAGELLATLCAIPGWSAELSSVNNNSGASDLAVTVPEDAPTPDKSLAKDLVTALHDVGMEAKGPEPPPLSGGNGGGRFRACGKLNPQHPTVDPSHPFNVKVEIQISRRL
jgi:hypothetical protein